MNKVWEMSWGEYVERLQLVLKQVRDIHTERVPVTDIIAVARGGLFPGVALSHHLDVGISFHVWHAAHYFGQKPMGRVQLVARSNVFKEHYDRALRHVIVVDDIMATGHTSEVVGTELDRQAEMESAGAHVVTNAVLVMTERNRGREDVVFGSVISNDTWVKFPYERG